CIFRALRLELLQKELGGGVAMREWIHLTLFWRQRRLRKAHCRVIAKFKCAIFKAKLENIVFLGFQKMFKRRRFPAQSRSIKSIWLQYLTGIRDVYSPRNSKVNVSPRLSPAQNNRK